MVKSLRTTDGNLVKEDASMVTNQTRGWGDLIAPEIADQPAHIESELCWCEPIIRVDENDNDVVIHRAVIWN